MKKIKILGAGISGLTSAINLAKSGFDVTVFEKNNDVGCRFNGDLQGLENWSEKEDIIEQFIQMNIEINFDCDPFSYIEFNDKKKNTKLFTKRPLYYLIKRGSKKGTFDYGLKQQALEAGIKIKFKTSIPLNVADVIAIGPNPKQNVGIVKGINFETNHPDIASLVFDDDFAYKGYGYLLITKGKGCLNTVVLKDMKKVAKCFEKTKQFFTTKYDFKIINSQSTGGVGSFSLDNVYKKLGAYNIGESAGLQDFLFGFGMRYAVQSGYLSAKCISEKNDFQKLANKKFNSKLKASLINRYLWEYFGKVAYSSMISYPKIWLKMQYSIHNFNIFQKILYPIAESNIKKKYPQIKKEENK